MGLLFAGTSRAAATYNADFLVPERRKGVLISINDTAGTGTVDVKLQYRDQGEDAWDDFPGAAIVQLTGTGETNMIVYPGITASATNPVRVSLPIPKILRCVLTIGTNPATVSVAAAFLE